METRSKEINGREYKILLPSVMICMPLASKLAVIIGPILGTLGQDAANGGMEKFAAALKGVDPIQLNEIMMSAVRASKLTHDRVQVSEPVQFEQHFNQFRSDVYQVSIWCVWECVKDFFPQLGQFAHVAKEAAGKAFLSQTDGQ